MRAYFQLSVVLTSFTP